MNAHPGGGGSGTADGQDEFLAPIRGGMNVALNAIVERFTLRSPVTVMVRRTLKHALSSQWIDEVFEAQRDKQYTRELLFSSESMERRPIRPRWATARVLRGEKPS